MATEAKKGTGGRGNLLAAFRNKQFDTWREARSQGVGTQHLIAMRQAGLQLKRKREMDRLMKGDSKTNFAAKRTQKLMDCRLKVAGLSVGPGMGPSADAGRDTGNRSLSAAAMAASAARAASR